MQTAERVTHSPHGSAPERLNDEHKALIGKVAASRDRSAFESLFAHFGPRVKTLMLKAGTGHAQAEDLVQDVMMTVWRKVDLYAPERGTVSTWIYTIARNARIDRLRRNSSRPYEDLDDVDLVSEDADAEAETLAGQQATRIAEALKELPKEQREIIELAFVHDLPQSEIATKLALPLGTVKSRMRLSYAKLRTMLEELK